MEVRVKRDRSGRLMACLSLILSGLTSVSVGWIFVRYSLHAMAPAELVKGHRLMAPATGIVLLLVSCTLVMPTRRGSTHRMHAMHGMHLLRQAAALAACAISAALLVSLAAYGEDRISSVLTHLLFGLPGEAGGQASATTAAGLFFLSSAQAMRLRNLRRIGNGLTLVPLLFSGVALLGYAYGVRDQYVFRVLNTLALHSSASLFALAVATLLIQHRHSWLAPLFTRSPGGTLSRQLVGVTFALPIAGWLLVRATQIDNLSVGVALAALIIVAVIPQLALALHAGARQDELHAQHDARAHAQAAFTETLERRLAQQAQALHSESEERSKAELAMFRAQRLEAIGQLTGGIAHDFNNLLMAIAGSHFLLDQQFRAEFAADHPARAYLRNAVDAAKRGEKLTHQLLAFSRKQKIDIRPTDLRQVIEAAVTMTSSALGPDIQLNWQVHEENIFIRSDATQLELALINLAMNARDAMPAGGVFTVSTANAQAADEGNPDRFVAIRATDTGTGMSADVSARAVEPFFTTKPQGKGTGLGLAQVYGFVRQCGGEFRLTSAPGEGTTVEMTFARTSRPPQSAPEPVASSHDWAVDKVDKLLLLIDDDDNVRAALGEIFRTAGYRVIESGDGEAGLDLLETYKPAAAIIDFLMPGMNGAQVARIARSLMPDLPIIFVSGYYDTLSLEGIADAVVMRKPVEVDALLERIAIMT
jgi:signal transduction histidine kinase/CheY-like chemotaxis protein